MSDWADVPNLLHLLHSLPLDFILPGILVIRLDLHCSVAGDEETVPEVHLQLGLLLLLPLPLDPRLAKDRGHHGV